MGVFSVEDEKKKVINGVVGFLKDDLMRVVLNQADLPEWLYKDKIGVNLLFDDGTYREMNKALVQVIQSKNNRLAELKAIFYGDQEARERKGHAYNLPTLNYGQNEAFANIIHAEDVMFVHGPPGTGKTTTLVKCIKETARLEKQVLVCAPSNAAIDLLVERLVEEGVNVVRLGHPARLTPEVIENSLDVRISKHPEFPRLKELRKKSEEFRAMAGKYKRHFGREERQQRNHLYKEARALKGESREIEDYITHSLIDQAEVVACTLTGASHQLIQDRHFKSVFIDESSQAMEAATWIPILRADRVIMSGDHHQLPPTIKSHKAAKAGLEDTLFAKGIRAQPDSVTMLQTQYRMEEAIMRFSSREFYEDRLEADSSIAHRHNPFQEPIRMIDTAGAGYEEKVKKETLSTYNEEEAALLVKLLEDEQLEGMSVGVIAPYKAQTELLRKLIEKSELLTPFRESIDVNSVDAFQGQERDVIYISLVRSNSEGEIGFLKEYRRMNVAMTRARVRLVLIGDSATLGHDPFFTKLIDYVQQHGLYESVYQLTDWNA